MQGGLTFKSVDETPVIEQYFLGLEKIKSKQLGAQFCMYHVVMLIMLYMFKVVWTFTVQLLKPGQPRQ